MRTFIVILASLISLSFIGCKEVNYHHNEVSVTNQTFKADFNKESYVWETLIFPKNKTMDK